MACKNLTSVKNIFLYKKEHEPIQKEKDSCQSGLNPGKTSENETSCD